VIPSWEGFPSRRPSLAGSALRGPQEQQTGLDQLSGVPKGYALEHHWPGHGSEDPKAVGVQGRDRRFMIRNGARSSPVRSMASIMSAGRPSRICHPICLLCRHGLHRELATPGRIDHDHLQREQDLWFPRCARRN
jgi:hypothetical protein